MDDKKQIEELEAYLKVLEDVIINILNRTVSLVGLDLARELVKEIEAVRPKRWSE